MIRMNGNMRISRRKFLNLVTLGTLGVACCGAWGFGRYSKSTMYDGDLLVSNLDEMICRLNYSKTLSSFDPYESNLAKPSFDTIEAQAHVIAAVHPTGKRRIGVRSIISEAIVDRVYAGNLQAGSSINILESMYLMPRGNSSKSIPEHDSSKLIYPSDTYVLFPEDPYVVGFTLMDASQNYLIFLREIPATSINGKPWGSVLYEVFRDVYSRISLSREATAYINKAGVLEKQVKDLKPFNIIVPDDECAQLYATNSEKIIKRYKDSD